jgi:hypothetical protein
LTAALTLRATTPEELDAIDTWVIDSWLDAPLAPISPAGALRLSIQQSLDEYDPDSPATLARPRNHRRTAWYEEYERPVLACTLTINQVEELLDAPDEATPLFSGVEFHAEERILAFDHDALRLRVERLDVELEVMPEVVAWRRKRLWRIGPLNFETGG